MALGRSYVVYMWYTRDHIVPWVYWHQHCTAWPHNWGCLPPLALTYMRHLPHVDARGHPHLRRKVDPPHHRRTRARTYRRCTRSLYAVVVVEVAITHREPDWTDAHTRCIPYPLGCCIVFLVVMRVSTASGHQWSDHTHRHTLDRALATIMFVGAYTNAPLINRNERTANGMSCIQRYRNHIPNWGNDCVCATAWCILCCFCN